MHSLKLPSARTECHRPASLSRTETDGALDILCYAALASRAADRL